jgi:hypothetical protein
MSEDVQIRPYQPGDERAILKSFNLVFREVCGPAFVDRDLAFWRWQFAQNPWGHRISVGVASDGTVASHYGGVPYPMRTCFGDCLFVHIVDSFTHPAHRKGLKKPGLFVETAYPWFETCRAAGDAVLYGYPVPIAERIGQGYLEYKRLRVVNYLVCDLARQRPAPAGIDVRPLPDLGRDVDALFDVFARDKACLARRDARYLDWRYRTCPGNPYELLGAYRGGRLCGLMVLRPVHELIPNACTIADWIVPGDEEVADALLHAAGQRGRAAGRQRLLAIFAESAPEWAAMLRRGFEVMPSAATLERRLTHRIYHPQMTTEWLLANWWYTLGDSDLV